MSYYFKFKHKNENIALLQFNEDGEIENLKVTNPKLVPIMNADPDKGVAEWWRDRAIPEGRKRLKTLLKEMECETREGLLLKNLALSLTDAYWICPASIDFDWEDVNLFKNEYKKQVFHDPVGKMYYTPVADSTVGGSLEKEAVLKDGAWYLEKFSNPKYPDAQQNVNELFASLLHKQQNWEEYTDYAVEKDDSGICRKSICKYFTDEQTELLTAHELTGGAKYDGRFDAKEELDKFIATCVKNGISENYVRRFLDYQIMTDFIISNTDRHWSNFGVLRDTDSLRFISMAPIFDSGNSMFFDSTTSLNRASLLNIETNNIIRNDADILNLVTDKSIIDTDLLPTPKEVFDFYTENGISEERSKLIKDTYSKKLDLFLEFQHGFQISYSKEMFEYTDVFPFMDQKPSDAFFKK